MSQDEVKKIEVICRKCKKTIFANDKFCMHCGALNVSQKNEEIKTNNCIKCGAPIKVGDAFCNNCGHSFKSEKLEEIVLEKNEEVVEEKKSDIIQEPIRVVEEKVIEKKKKTKLGLIILIVSLVCVVTFGAIYVYLDYVEREKELAEQLAREKVENERVERALSDQLLYWNLEFASPNNDGTYSTFYPYDEASNTVYYDRLCVLVGVKADKQDAGEFYLDDSVDGGLFNFNLSEFTINNYTPLNAPNQDCNWNLGNYTVEYADQFSLLDDESALVLFNIYLSDLSLDEYDFKYKYKVITILDTSSLE